jgi:hypothetical protein
MSEVRALIRELSESTVWGGHITFGQGIAGPPRLENFLRVQFEGKKIATSPKKGDAKGGQNLEVSL